MRILIHTLHIREERQLFCIDCPGNRTRRIIGIDVIRLKGIVQANGAHNGQEILFQQIIKYLSVDFLNVTHIADVLPF